MAEGNPFPKSARRDCFYIDGKLYKKIHVYRPHDLVLVWDYQDKCEKHMIWSYVKRTRKPAYTTREVAKLVGRGKFHILNMISKKLVPAPYLAPVLRPGSGHKGSYMWSEEDILRLHDYLMTVGVKNKKGMVIPRKLIPRTQLLQLLKHDVVQYVKTKDGEFVPVWKEAIW